MEKRIVDAINSIYKTEEVNNNPTFYLYDLSDISKKVKAISDNASKNISLYYAMKANPNRDIMEYISNEKYINGIEIASSGELNKALEFYPSNNVIFTGPGKTENELRESIEKGIRLINCESIIEAYRINRIASELKKKVDVLLRINTNYYIEDAAEHMAGKSTKMGIDEDEFEATYKEILNFKNINVCGIHVFSASGILDYEVLIKYIDYVFTLASNLENKGMSINIIDFGGGIGIDYSKNNIRFDIEDYFKEMKSLINKYGFQKKELILELGTYLVGECGYYSTKINDIKEIKGMKHIITVGGFHHIRLPMASGRKSPVYILNNNCSHFCNKQISVKNEIADIDGPLCMDEDKISWDEFIEEADIGDYVVVTQSGAYCFSAAGLHFLSHELPFEFILDNREVKKCVSRF